MLFVNLISNDCSLIGIAALRQATFARFRKGAVGIGQIGGWTSALAGDKCRLQISLSYKQMIFMDYLVLHRTEADGIPLAGKDILNLHFLSMVG